MTEPKPKYQLRSITDNPFLGFSFPEGYEFTFDKFKTKDFPHYQMFALSILHLRARGFTVQVPEYIRKDYACLSGSHRHGKNKMGLEVEFDIYPTGMKFEFYQNVTKPVNPNGGKHDFHKFEKMPYLLKKSVLLERSKLIALFSSHLPCEVVEMDSPQLAVERILQHFQRHSFTRNKITALEEIEGMMSESDHAYNRTDRDGKKLLNGAVKYFRDYDGYLKRGQVWHNINNMWWVITSKFTLRNIASFNLFDATPQDFAQRRLKKQVIPEERQARMQIINSLTKGEIQRIIRKKAKVA